MFRSRNTMRSNRKMIAVGAAVGVGVLIAIVLLAVILKGKEKHKEVELDRIECPGFYTMHDCVQHGCLYDPVEKGPACYMKKDSYGYTLSEIKDKQNGRTGKLSTRSKDTPYGPSLDTITVDVDYITDNILRVKFLDPKAKRYEVPVQNNFPLLQKPSSANPSKMVYEFLTSNTGQKFDFRIVRKDDKNVLFDTSIGGLVMSDKYLQIASYLPSNFIFGLGEHTRDSLRHNLNYSSWPMFSRDRTPERGQINLYGVHPFYTCLENSSKSHGVLLLNSNAMEVTVMPAPGISFRTIGGVIDLFFFVGDNPEHVIQLYTSMIGRPLIPPYWGLGFQLSRYGYNKLENVIAAVNRTREADIPQDVQFLDIDHMEGNKDFTYNKKDFAGLISYINETKTNYGLKWIIIIDPAIAASNGYSPYESGIDSKVYIKRSPAWNKTMFPPSLQDLDVTFGKVWPNEPVAFPDFLLPETKKWWVDNLVAFHKVLPFDGLWIDMNEPSNFGTNEEDPDFCKWQKIPKDQCWALKCPQSPYDDPPYNPLNLNGSSRLSTMTLCMESIQGKDTSTYRHYDVHSLYGWLESVATLEAAEKSTGTRSLVISRSTYPSSGRYTGHWLGDNRSIWRDLHDSVIGMMEFNFFGIPYIGADVCGFDLDTTPELCYRWMQLGAFYPFYRNHNGMGRKDQDPAALGSEVIEISKKAVDRRYTLLPYLYTLFYGAHVDGNTVIKPLFHEFPLDKKTWTIDEQFMWGKCFIVSPILKEGQKSVPLYLPKGEWWEFKYENSTLEKNSGAYIDKIVTDYIPMHARGGCIIPTEDIKLRTPSKDEVRNISLYLYPESNKASGELFIDDGISQNTVEDKRYDLYKYQMNNCDLDVSKSDTSYHGPETQLKQIIVFKAMNVSNVNVNSSPTTDFSFNNITNVLAINVNRDMKTVKKISWGNKENKCQTSK